MKSLKYSLLITATLLASAAHAESTFVLQLGTFDNQAKAEERWQSVSKNYASLVGKLTPKVSEVSLPPDNYTVYRTQAGPLASKEAAQDICAKLTAEKLECLVVETAMFTAEEPKMAKVEEAPKPAPAGLTPLPDLNDEIIPSAKESLPASLPPEPLKAEAAKPEPVAAESEPKMEVAASAQAPKEVEVKNAEPEEKSTSLKKILFPWLDDEDEEEAKAAPQQMAEKDVPEAPMADAPAPMPAPVAAPAPEIVEPAPAAKAENKEPAIIPAAPAIADSKTAPKALMDGNEPKGEVKVAEAIRVPVSSQSAEPMMRPSAAPRPFALRDTVPYRTYPSQNLHQRTYWAKIGYFNSNDAALGYWNQLRSMHPELAGNVRARVTSAFATRGRAAPTSLQIGPFAKTEGAYELCGAVGGDGVSCSVSADLGASATAGVARKDATARSYQMRRYNARAHGSTVNAAGAGLYWVMLGSYSSPQDADDAWQGMQSSQRDLLGKLKSNVASPLMSSSTTPSYRLRTGPFASMSNATQLCDSLRWRGVQCLVLNDR